MIHKYTDEERKFILENAGGRSNLELAGMVNQKFNINLTESQIKGYKANHKINSGLTGRFQKGCVPLNKGKKMSVEQYELCKGTMFKKGNRSVNYRPVGSERVNVDGYVEIKVADPNKWRLKHRVVYEKVFGKIQRGYVLLFLDGNKLNLKIENLGLVTRNELARLNQKHLIFEDAERTKASINLIRLENLIREKKKGEKNGIIKTTKQDRRKHCIVQQE